MQERQQPGFNIMLGPSGIQLDQVEEIIKEQNGFIADIESIFNDEFLVANLIFDTMRNAELFARRMTNAGVRHNTPKLINTNIHKGLPATRKEIEESSLR